MQLKPRFVKIYNDIILPCFLVKDLVPFILKNIFMYKFSNKRLNSIYPTNLTDGLITVYLRQS